nr:ABC transporter permease [Clostridia bacterium]
ETYGGVREAKFRTKEEAMDIMRQRWGENSYLLDSLGENPLPNSIVLSMDSMESANNLTEKVKALEGVEDIKYYKETVEKLGRVSNALRITSIAIIAFLLIVSIIIVSNTIKLTVMARAKEIEIMKYIGGTNWFIRGPFLVEGIILGTVASAVAALVTYLIYREVIVLVGRSFMTIMGSPLVPAEYMLNNLLIIFIALGVSIGACGSIVSMRKFLNR